MYPPAPDQQPSSPYTPAGVTGSTPNNNPNPSSTSPQPQMGGFPPSTHPQPMSAFAPNMIEFGGMPYGTGQMPMQQGNPANQGAIQTPASQQPQPAQGFAKGGLAHAAAHLPAAHHAQEAQKHGRGEDTMLIHMTPGEVGGLQALAQAHGGSLTVNPHTGLPEAGWLSKLLPTILGFGLSFIPGIGPLMAAGITGLGTAAVTGDLRQGLMAGLGAFGGASLAGGLGVGAAANASKTIATTLPEATTAATALPSAVAPAANLAGVTNAVPAVGKLSTALTSDAAQAVSKAGSLMPSNLNLIGSYGNAASTIPSAGANLVDTALPTFGGAAARSVAPAAPNLMGKLLGPKGQAFGERFANTAGQNLTGTASTPAAWKTGLAATGLANSVMGAMTPDYTMPTLEEYKSNYKGPYKPAPRNVRYLKDANRDPNDSSEFQYFDTVNPYPSYVPAGGGLASGGPVRYGNGGSASVGDITVADGVDVTNVTPAASTYTLPKDNVVFAPKGYVPGQDAEHDYGFSKLSGGAASKTSAGGGGGAGAGGPGTVSGLGGVFNTMPGVISGGGTDAQNNLDTYINNAQSRIDSTPSGLTTGISPGLGTGLGLDFNGGTSPGGMSFNLGGSGSGSTGYAHSSGYYYDPTQMSLWGDESDTGGLGGQGLQGLASGGMTLRDGAFIVDARTVSELGNGSSSAGQELLAKHGGVPIKGPGDGVSDSIRANIGGKQEARVARDEVKFDPEAVARLGNGNTSAGARKLYALMNKAHKARKSAKRGQDTGLRGAL